MYRPPDSTISSRPSFKAREILVWMPDIDIRPGVTSSFTSS